MIELFVQFIAILSCVLLFNNKIVLGISFFLLFSFLIKRQEIKSKKFYLALLAELLFIISIIIISKISFNNGNSITGLVIRKNQKYIILWNGISKFYIKIESPNIDYFDIVSFSGAQKKLYISSIENAFNFNEYLNNKGVFFEYSSNDYNIIFNNPINLFSTQNAIINRFDNENSKYLISLLLFGREAEISDSNISVYGVARLINNSGIYIYFVIHVLYKILNQKLSDKNSEIISFLLLIPFYLLNISRFTVIRFVLLKTFRLINKYKLKNKFENLDILSISGIFFVLIDPYVVFEQSFYISYLISFFMNFNTLFFKPFKRFKLKIFKKIFILILILPFNFKNNNTFNIIAFLISIITHELFKPLFFVSLFFIFIPPLSIVDSSLGIVLTLFQKIPFKYFSIGIPKFTELIYVIYYLFILLFIYFKEVNFKKYYKKISSISLTCLLIYVWPFTNYFSNEISFINVGQGDCSLIKYHQKVILIDTGGLTYCDTATECIIPYLRNLKIYHIDAVFITHNDYDHSGSLNSLNSNFDVRKTYTYNDNFPIKVGNIEFNNLNVYWNGNDEENKKSLVLETIINEMSFLFMGDAPQEIEKEILKNNEVIKCDILKVGHHGSSSSTSEEFIKKIKPKEAIISCGYNNKYHHPNNSIIEILEKYNTTIRRTDLEGTIKYKFYG